ncbi:TPA: AbiH family protein [Vibrio cholerae]
MHFYFPAYFINFNYTTTLQDVYKVNDSDVLHIHGKIGKELIFGHGRETDLSESEDENNEPWFHETKREVSQVLSVFHKPVNDILARNRTILEGYDNVENIVVIGHSINNIDIPYFQCILNAYPDANWQNYNYENIEEEIDEVSVTHSKLLALGVPEQRLKSFSSEKLKELYPLP